MTQNVIRRAAMAGSKKGVPKTGQFKKGNPGGPGRPKDPVELIMTRSLNKTEANAILQKFLFWTVSELKNYLKDDSNLVIEYYVAKLIYMGIVENQIGPLSFLFDRILGIIVDKVEISRPSPTIIELIHNKRQIVLDSQIQTEVMTSKALARVEAKNENNS